MLVMKKRSGSERLSSGVLFFLFISALILLSVSCAPRIISFTPEEGPAGTDVAITGKNFKVTPAENTVKFGEIIATDVSVPQEDKIIAKVPTGAKTALISVRTKCGTGYSDKNFIVPTPSTWTFMVYLDGDNSLESAGLDDFLEMASVGSSKQVNIVVQMDRTAGLYHTAAYGNWQDTRRFFISKNLTPAASPLQNLGEQNMGDPKVLEDFVEWAITNYPAEHYALSIWNHGGGWRMDREELAKKAEVVKSRGGYETSVSRAVCSDDTDGDILYMKEVQQALESAKNRLQERYGVLVKLDVVGFDACLMGMVEVAYALRDVTNYMVGSEMVEPGDGWPYNTIISDLVATPSMAARNLAGLIVTKYYNSYPSSSQITQAAVDIAALPQLTSKIDIFTSKATSEWDKLKTARSSSRVYHVSDVPNSYWGVDLWDYADRVYSQVVSAELKASALELKNAIESFMVNELHSSDMAGSHGIAIYFPETLAVYNNDPDHPGYEESNTFMPVDFVKYHTWDNWLKNFYSNIPL